MNGVSHGKENLCTYYIVRHGESEWNIQQRIHGHADSPLTSKGKDQVKELAEQLRRIRFNAIFASDLVRAKDTAALIALEHDLAVKTTEALRERRYGHFEGKHKDEFERATQPLLIQFADLFDREKNRSFLDQHNIEDDQTLARRVITFLREIALAHVGQTVLLVTHGAVMRTLMVHLGFARHDQLGWGTISNAAFVTLKSDGVDFFLDEVQGVRGFEKKRNT